MSCLTRAQGRALVALADLWPGVPVVLVSAVAFACRLSALTRITNSRTSSCTSGSTNTRGWPSLPAGRREGEHAWRSPDGIKVDVVPSGPSAITNEAESEEVAAFVAAASDTDAVTHARMIRLAPGLWSRDPEVAPSRLAAFARGFAAARSMGGTR